MGKINKPRHGSMAVRPRKRATSQTARIGCWHENDAVGLLGFAGYKAGMTHVMMVDDDPASVTKGHEIFAPVTVIEAPPLFIFGIRGYRRCPSGFEVVCDAYADNVDAKVRKALTLPKQANKEAMARIEGDAGLCEVRVLTLSAPQKTGFGKKTPELMEFAIGGKDVKEKMAYAKGILGKEVKASDALKEGEYLDAVAVTTGRGWQGAVKRFGISMQRRKATGKYRHVGTLGPWHPAFVMYTVPMAGQTGYHKRTEYNKRLLKIGAQKERITPDGGFLNYGVVKNDFLLLKGSVGGPMKRLVRLRKALRGPKVALGKPEIKVISLDSKQGA